MIIVCYGMIKSASTFTFQALDKILERESEANGGDYIRLQDVCSSYEFNFVDGKTDFDRLIADLKSCGHDFNGTSKHILIKTHQPKSRLANLLDEFEVACVASYRHPAEVALSLVDAAKKDKELNRGRFDSYADWDIAVQQLPYQCESFLSWTNFSRFIPVFYDDIASNPAETIAEVCKRLNIVDYGGEVVSELVSNPSKITEYNKGILDRKSKELPASLIKDIESDFPEMMSYIWGR